MMKLGGSQHWVDRKQGQAGKEGCMQVREGDTHAEDDQILVEWNSDGTRHCTTTMMWIHDSVYTHHSYRDSSSVKQ